MELREYLDILRRSWLSILLITLTTLALASIATLMMPKAYTATTRLYFAVDGNSVSDLAQGSSFAAQQMSSYAEVATSPLVLDAAISELGLSRSAEDLKRSIDVTVPLGTVIIHIAATDRDPRRAALIANTVGERLSEEAERLTASREETVRATTIAFAQVPSAPSSPNISRNLGLGLILGLVLGTGIAVLRQVLDTKVRSVQDVRSLTDSPILGQVAFDQEVSRHPVILRDEPLTASSEAVRRLRTNLQFIDVANRPKSIVISSSVTAEGKSTIAINLAVSLADTGARVILVDADLRRPSIADYVGVEGSVGLTTVLIGRADVEEVVQPFGNTSLDLLPAGQVPPNPSELLGSPSMVKLLDRLTASYDIVLLDTPPLLPVTDAAVLAKLAGGALVVVGADRIHRPQLQDTMESLQTAGVHVFGLVVNKIDPREAGGYAYDSRYVSNVRDRLTVSAQITQWSRSRKERVTTRVHQVGEHSVDHAAMPTDAYDSAMILKLPRASTVGTQPYEKELEPVTAEAVELKPDGNADLAARPGPEDAAEKVPADQAAEKVPADQAAEKVPADQAAEKLPADQAAEKVPADQAAEKVPADQAAEKLPADQAAEKLPADQAPEEPTDQAPEEPTDHAAEKVPADQAPEEPTDHAAEKVPADQAPEEPTDQAPEEPTDHAAEKVPADQAPEEPTDHAAEKVPADQAPEEPTDHAAEKVPADQPPEEEPTDQAEEKPAGSANEESSVNHADGRQRQELGTKPLTERSVEPDFDDHWPNESEPDNGSWPLLEYRREFAAERALDDHARDRQPTH